MMVMVMITARHHLRTFHKAAVVVVVVAAVVVAHRLRIKDFEDRENIGPGIGPDRMPY